MQTANLKCINSDSALPLCGVAGSAENRDDYDSLLLRPRSRRRREIDELTRGEFRNEDPDIRLDGQRFAYKQREVLQEIQTQALAPRPHTSRMRLRHLPQPQARYGPHIVSLRFPGET